LTKRLFQSRPHRAGPQSRTEWKFNYSHFTFDSPAIIHATYAVHHFVVGVGYHFL
jgi:hypothetical protein